MSLTEYRQSRDNMTGSLMMAAAMAGFAVEDVLVKTAARAVPLGQILVLSGLVGMMVFAIGTLRRGEPVLHPAMIAPRMIARSAFEIAGRLFYALAFTLTPLSVASAILQASPLLVVAGAALIFGETVGWRRWSAILSGFAGVLIILRPGLSGFDALSILAVLGTIGFSGRDLATRAAPPALSHMQLGIVGFAMLGLSGAVILAVTGRVAQFDAATLATTLASTAFGASAYFALTVAMRTGEVSAVTPFRYTRLVFAMVLGVLVFGERPDAATLAGSAIVVASGLYVLIAARRRKLA